VPDVAMKKEQQKKLTRTIDLERGESRTRLMGDPLFINRPHKKDRYILVSANARQRHIGRPLFLTDRRIASHQPSNKHDKFGRQAAPRERHRRRQRARHTARLHL
jgi:hypothetical protein